MKKQFGGANTSPRRARNLRYAARIARQRNQLFYWTVVGTSRKRGGGRTAFPGVIGFATAAEREAGVLHFARMGANHFTFFRDTNATYALQIGCDARRRSITVNR